VIEIAFGAPYDLGAVVKAVHHALADGRPRRRDRSRGQPAKPAKPLIHEGPWSWPLMELDSPWNLTICARAVHPIICYKLVTRFLGGMPERAPLTIATPGREVQ